MYQVLTYHHQVSARVHHHAHVVGAHWEGQQGDLGPQQGVVMLVLVLLVHLALAVVVPTGGPPAVSNP